MNPGVFVVLFLFSIVYIGECTISRLEYCGIQPGTNINYPRPPSNMTLLKVQVLMRHGDRLPHSTCWKNNFVWKCSSEKEERRSLIDTKVSRLHRIKYIENKNTYPGNCMMGQLTDYGWDQHVTNGKNLRNVYVNYHRLLNNSFDLSQFYIRSTDYARTIQSAQALLEGLYPSDTHRNIIEINTVDSQTEWMSPNTKRCPIVQKYMNEFYNSKTYEKRLEEVIKPLYKDVSNVLGIPIEDLPTSVADCFFAFKCHNADLPANATESLIKRLQENEEWIQKSLVSYPDPKTIGRLVSGELIFNVFDSFLKTIIGQKKEIFEIYSVHDTTIMPYLNALNSWDGKWTKYASTLIHELYKSGNDYFVRTLYNGEELLLSGCKNIYCNFEDYEEIVRPLIPNDITKECKVNHFM